VEPDPFTQEFDLCDPPSFGQFTCSAKADGEATWPCTGSAHFGGEHIRCTCPCHGIDPPHFIRPTHLSVVPASDDVRPTPAAGS
jgi:hypothetical protein